MISKLAKFAIKMFSRTNRQNCGKLLKTIDSNGQKIEVFQKKTGSRLLGNRRTVTTRFAEGSDDILSQTVRQKKGNVLSTYTQHADGAYITTRVNTKTGAKEASVYTRAADGNHTRSKFVFSQGTNNTTELYTSNVFGDQITTFKKFDDKAYRGVEKTFIANGNTYTTKTYIDKQDNTIHQLSDDPIRTVFYKEGQTWTPPATPPAKKLSTKQNAAIGIGLGTAIGAGGIYLISETNSEPEAAAPVEARQPEEGITDGEDETIEETTVPENSTATEEDEPEGPAAPAAPADSTATAPNAPVAPADSTATAPNAPVAPADSTATAPNAPVAPADSTATAPNAPAAPTQAPQQPVQPQAPRNNIFGGTINEISIKEYDVKPKDCLWNIARRELEKANPGVTINNGQVLAQVKEFIRLNPQIKNPDLIYPNQKIKLAA